MLSTLKLTATWGKTNMSKYKIVNRNINLEALKPYTPHADCLYIVDWLIGFMKSGNMNTAILTNHKTGQKELFYHVKYDTLLKDIQPIVSYNSKKTISRRFKEMEDSGLLNRGYTKQGGTEAYCNFNSEKLKEILDGKDKSVKELLKPYEKKLSSANDQRTELSIPMDNVVHSIGEDKVVRSYINNTNIKLTTTTTDEVVVADKTLLDNIRQIVLNVCGTISVFSNDFFSKIAYFMNDKDMSLLPAYIQWCKDYSESKSKTNFIGYFYSTVTRPNVWNTFLSELEKKVSEVSENYDGEPVSNTSNIKYVTCPACNNQNQAYEDCQFCNLRWDNFKNPSEVSLHKQLYALPEASKKLYEDGVTKIYTEHPSVADGKIRKELMQKLYAQFNITTE